MVKIAVVNLLVSNFQSYLVIGLINVAPKKLNSNNKNKIKLGRLFHMLA